MKCPTCGEEVEGLDRCDNCGTPIPRKESNNNSPAHNLGQKPADSTESKNVENDAAQVVIEYSSDSDLEFADADSLLNDIDSKPVSAADNTVSPSSNKINDSSIINQLREEISPEAESETEVEQAFNEFMDQKLTPAQTEVNKPVGDEIELAEMQPDLASELQVELMQEQSIGADTKREITSDRQPDEVASSQTSQSIPISAEVPPSKNSTSEPIQQNYIRPEIQIPKPPPGAAKVGIPASLYYQQQDTPEAHQQSLEEPASVTHQEGSFSSFVNQEQPLETSNSSFVKKQHRGTDEATSYDFQPSIYYKQILGDSPLETGLHRDEILLTKSERIAQDEKEVAPSFARSFKKPDSNMSTTESHARAVSVQPSFTQSRPRIDDSKLGDDNKIISIVFKVVFMLFVLSSFFLMDVFTTINSPLNPYDQHKSSRYLVFIFIAAVAIISLFIKNLTGKLIVIMPMFLLITVFFLYGVTNLKIAIKPDAMKNFYVVDTDPPIDVAKDDSYDATEPAISSTGQKAMYSIRKYNTGLAYHKVGLIEFMTKDKKAETKLKDTALEINGNAQWFENDMAIYSELKTELPAEMNNPVLMASRNELYFDFTSTFNIYDFNNRITQQLYQFKSKLPFSLFLKQILNKSENTILIQLSMIYTSPEKATFNFVYNDKSGLISTCYMGGIWLIDPSKGVSRKITRGGEPGSPYLDTWPKFNDAGDKILFVRTRIGENIENDILQIDTATALASEEIVLPVSVTNDNFNYLNFAISPGGRFIAAWIFASQNAGAKQDETALILFDMKLNKHIKIYPLEQYDRVSDQFISNIEWSKKGNYLLIQFNRLLHSSIKRIEVPEAISDIDK